MKQLHAWVVALTPALVLGAGHPHFSPDPIATGDRQITAIYRLANQPTGRYRETAKLGPNGEVETTIDSDLVFNRLATKLEMKSSTRYAEDRTGRLTGIVCDISSSKQTTHIVVKDEGASLTIKTTAGGKSYDRNLAYTGSLFGPEAARKFALQSLRAIGQSASYQVFQPEMGAVQTVTDKLIAKGKVSVDGRKVDGMELEQTFSAIPGKSILWLDESGWLLSQTIPSGLGEIVAARTDKTAATSNPVGAELPSETFSRSVVTSNIRLPEERLIERIRIKILHRHPELGWPDFLAPNQKLLQKTRNFVVLEITRPTVTASSPRPACANTALDPYLAPNALLQSDDPLVKAIADKIVKKTDDSWTAVRALQRWTNDNMHFDMGVAVVPASEVARNRRGTCFGYSMILGALARAAGVPSRLRMGLVYAGGIWGGHAWVDVMIGSKWVPIDGALYSPGPADAARFSVFTGSLEENTVANMGGLAQMFGNIDIKILEYTVRGKQTTVPDSAKPFSVAGNKYSNRWIGFSVVKPENYRFSGLDLVWPQTTLVAMNGPHHERVEVQNESDSLPSTQQDADKLLHGLGLNRPARSRTVGRHRVLFSEGHGKAGLVLQDRGSVWLLSATGAHASRTLIAVARTISLGGRAQQ